MAHDDGDEVRGKGAIPSLFSIPMMPFPSLLHLHPPKFSLKSVRDQWQSDPTHAYSLHHSCPTLPTYDHVLRTVTNY
jgi:hypothetical protein